MSTTELLTIEPQELQFPFELKKQISCSMQLKNNTNDYVAFKVKTTNPKKYCVRPNTGVVLPHSVCDVTAWILNYDFRFYVFICLIAWILNIISYFKN
ncbi:putative major sperm protein (MSP) [Helianthus annuus]|nr:putative major sperm protein (MSP) [Helianthus annuus]